VARKAFHPRCRRPPPSTMALAYAERPPASRPDTVYRPAHRADSMSLEGAPECHTNNVRGAERQALINPACPVDATTAYPRCVENRDGDAAQSPDALVTTTSLESGLTPCSSRAP